MLILDFILFWLACSILSYGFSFAFWQGEWPGIAEQTRKEDRLASALLAVGGPFTLISSALYSLICGRNYFSHGWRIK